MAGVQFGAFLGQGGLGTGDLRLLGVGLQARGLDLGLHALRLPVHGLEVALGTAGAALKVDQVFLACLDLRRRQKALLREALVACQARLRHGHSLVRGVQLALRLDAVALQAAQAVPQGVFTLLGLGGGAASLGLQGVQAGLQVLPQQQGGVALVAVPAQMQHCQHLPGRHGLPLAHPHRLQPSGLRAAELQHTARRQQQASHLGLARGLAEGGKGHQGRHQGHSHQGHGNQAGRCRDAYATQELARLRGQRLGPEQRLLGRRCRIRHPCVLPASPAGSSSYRVSGGGLSSCGIGRRPAWRGEAVDEIAHETGHCEFVN